jgi:hypothetical protein
VGNEFKVPQLNAVMRFPFGNSTGQANFRKDTEQCFIIDLTQTNAIQVPVKLIRPIVLNGYSLIHSHPHQEFGLFLTIWLASFAILYIFIPTVSPEPVRFYRCNFF